MQVFEQHERARASITALNVRLTELRKTGSAHRRPDARRPAGPVSSRPQLTPYPPAAFWDEHKPMLSVALQKLSSAQAALERMKKSKEEALAKLGEAAAISTNLTSLGTHRDAVMLHALNGLANTKALYASGERLSIEVSGEREQGRRLWCCMGRGRGR